MVLGLLGVLMVFSPDSMTKVDSQKLKKKRMNQRMVHISYVFMFSDRAIHRIYSSLNDH